MKELKLTPDEIWGFKVIPSEPYERPGSKEFIRLVKAGKVDQVASILSEAQIEHEVMMRMLRRENQEKKQYQFKDKDNLEIAKYFVH